MAAKDPLSDEYFLFTRYLNFWEEIGLEFCDHSGGLKIVDEMFGDLITAAWHDTWKQVIARVWGTRTTVGGGFRRIVEKIERKRTWRRRRRRLFSWLSTPYYDTDPPGAGCVD